jgi:RimK family alpha-L-glutamate ligase
MKIAVVTTLPKLVENERIRQEVEKLGHTFSLVDMQQFGFEIKDNQLEVEQTKDLEADVIIVRGVFLAIKTISVMVNSLRKSGVKIFDNNFLEHRYSIDKVTDIVKLSVFGVDVPDTLYSRDFGKYQSLANKLSYPFVIKSSRMGKGANVFLIRSKDGLKTFIDEAESEGKSAKSFLLQQYIDYAYDLRVLVVGDQVFTMRRIPAEGEFRANFSLGGKVESYGLDEEGKKLALDGLKAVDMSVGGVDILIDKGNRRYILEVNHTAGFVGMEKATGKNIGRVYVEHAIANAK